MLDSYQDTYRTGLWFEIGVVGLGMVGTSNPPSLILEDLLGPQCFCREHYNPGGVDSVTLYSILSLSHVGVEFFQYPLLMD